MPTTARPHTTAHSVSHEAVPHSDGEYGEPKLFPNFLSNPNPEQHPLGQTNPVQQSLRQQQNLTGHYQPYSAELSPPLPGPSLETSMPEDQKPKAPGHSSNLISGLMQRLFPAIWPHPSHFSTHRKTSHKNSIRNMRPSGHSFNSSVPYGFNDHSAGEQTFTQTSMPSQSPAMQNSTTYRSHQNGSNSHKGNLYSDNRDRGHQANGTQPAPPRASMGISNFQYLMTGGCLLLALVLMTDVQQWLPKAEVKDICKEVIQPDAILSRTHLAQLLAVSERTAKTAIQQVVAEPYCRLPSVSIRAGITAEREVYPLAFDPDTWLVMLYEGDEYAGFDFSFRK